MIDDLSPPARRFVSAWCTTTGRKASPLLMPNQRRAWHMEWSSQMQNLLRERAWTLASEAPRIAQRCTAVHLSLNDWWCSALVRTPNDVAAGRPIPMGADLDRILGTPRAWTDVMLRDPQTVDLRTWLRSLQSMADTHVTKTPTSHT